MTSRGRRRVAAAAQALNTCGWLGSPLQRSGCVASADRGIDLYVFPLR